MKKIIIIFGIVIMVIGGAVYWIGTQNFCFGSANYYRTAFDIENSEWYCEELQLRAETANYLPIQFNNCMIVSSDEPKYIFEAIGHKLIGVYPYIEEYDEEYFENVLVAEIKYRKRFGKVCGIVISGINKQNLALPGNDTIEFHKN